MRVAGSAKSATSRSSTAAYTSDVGASKVKEKDIAEHSVYPVDRELHGRKVSTIHFDPGSYYRKASWITIFQIDVLPNSRYAVFQKH